MAFSPTSRVYLLDTPLDNTYKHQIDFTSKTAQYNYFSGRIRHTFPDVTYQRKDNKIRVNRNIDDLWNVNYVMYQNTNFGSKWFYAFITKMEYVSAEVTDVFIETDVYQTWLFECSLKPSFVVREHVIDDTIGVNLVDEGLDYGEYKMKTYEKTGLLDELWFVMAVSDLLTGNPVRSMYGGVYSGLIYFPFAPTSEGIESLSTFIQTYVDAGKGEAIQFIFSIPRAILPTNTVSGTSISTSASTISSTWSYPIKFKKVEGLETRKLDGYMPRNRKLYTYPYNLFYVSNNQGGYAEYRFENFPDIENTDDIQFFIRGNIAPNPTIVCEPNLYNRGLDENGDLFRTTHENAISLSGYPLCSWGNDTFNAWVAQNGVSTAINVVTSLGAVIGGIATGNVVAGVGGAVGIASQMAQVYKASIQPATAKGNTNNGSLNVASKTQDFYMSHMTIKAEFAQRIDEYFNMFGYKVNALKVPNINTREHWNYVQTIDVNIDGTIPDEDMRKLKDVYNNGVTFWHDPSEFLNYGLKYNYNK